MPRYDPERAHDLVLATHPEMRTAQVGVERAQAAVKRAQAEAIPNVTVYTGYIRQYENKSHDFQMGVNAPIPVWNRNQGNIRAAQAELGAAVQEVARVENELAERFATAFRAYSAARAAPNSIASRFFRRRRKPPNFHSRRSRAASSTTCVSCKLSAPWRRRSSN